MICECKLVCLGLFVCKSVCQCVCVFAECRYVYLQIYHITVIYILLSKLFKYLEKLNEKFGQKSDFSKISYVKVDGLGETLLFTQTKCDKN